MSNVDQVTQNEAPANEPAPQPTPAKPVKADAQPQVKAEPTKLAAVPDVPAAPQPDPLLEGLQKQLADQQAALAALQKQLAAERAAAEQAREQAKAQRRLQYLASINGGLHSEHYASLAPANVDADTDEGKAALKQWAQTNAALFRGVHSASAPQPSQFAVPHPTFAGRAIKTAAELLGLNKGGDGNG